MSQHFHFHFSQGKLAAADSRIDPVGFPPFHIANFFKGNERRRVNGTLYVLAPLDEVFKAERLMTETALRESRELLEKIKHHLDYELSERYPSANRFLDSVAQHIYAYRNRHDCICHCERVIFVERWSELDRVSA